MPLFKSIFNLICCLFLIQKGVAQTNPVAQQIPLSQDFGNLWFNSAPTGFAVWKVSGAPSTSLLSAANSIANGDEIIDTATVVKSPGKAYGYSGVGVGGVNVNNGQLYIQTSSTSSGSDQLILAINTSGFSNIRVSYEVEMINPQLKKTGIVFQYRIGTTGSWTIIDSSYNHNSADKLQNQIDYFVNLLLGSAADNQSVVKLRWATSRESTPIGAGSCGLAFDNIIVSGDPVTTPLYFRSVASGNWNNVSTWESSPDALTWSPAINFPSAADRNIQIRFPHTVSTSGLTNLVIDELTIDAGATMVNAFNTALAIEDGPQAIELNVNGTFEDSSSVSVVWVNTSRWQMGVTGTYIKTYNTNSTNWQFKYYNGIATIPATSNWICRKAVGSSIEPSISTTNGGPPFPQATYGNLYIENNSGTWNANTLCRFSGSNNAPLIKGNFYIGGNGSGTVSFLSSNTFTLPIKVVGNIVIASGSALRNEGTGFEIQGDLICNGIHSYGSSASLLLFSGNNIQTVSGTGSISVWKTEINKTTNELYLATNISVYNSLSLVNGIVNTAVSSTFIVQDNATAINSSNSSFVRGPMNKIGNDAFIFPVGKGNLLRTIGMDAGTGLVTDMFSAEYFYVDPQTVYGNTLDPSLDHISSCEYWLLNQNTGNSQRKVTLSWASNSCGVTNISDLRVARYNNLLWVNEGHFASAGSLAAGTVTSNVTTGFGPFTLASATPQNPLPIELISFTAIVVDDHIETEWVTASEINNDFFTVEKSRSGIDFSPVGIVDGAGSSTLTLEYELKDEGPYNGISYYRLKQTDYDGKFSYSPIVAVKVKHSTAEIISVLAQKETGSIEVKISFVESSNARLIIQDVNGKIVYEVEISGNAEILTLPVNLNISSGLYFVRLITAKENLIKKFYY